MRTSFAIVIAAVAGAVIGAAAVQGLHAQGKPKAYFIGEVDITGQTPPDALTKLRAAMEAAGGRSLYTLHGRVVVLPGSAPPPKNIGLVEWSSLDAALAFYGSKAWTDYAASVASAETVHQRFIVEAEH